MIPKINGSFKVASLVTVILLFSFFILGMPLDGHIGRFSVGSLGPLGDSNPVREESASRAVYVALIWGSLYIIAFWVFLRRIEYLKFAINSIPFYALFLVYLAASCAWSSQTSLGLMEIAQLAGSVALCSMIAIRYRHEPDSFVRHVALALGAAQLLSTLLILVAPSFGVAPNGRWAGMYGAPNYLGSLAFCSLWANVAVITILKPVRVRLFILFALASLANLWGTNSVTSIVSAAVMLVLIWFWPHFAGCGRTQSFNRIFVLLLGLIIISGYLFGLADSLIETLFSFCGRSVDLTGRGDIWHESFAAIGQYPIFGSGFGSKLTLVSIERLTDLHSSYVNTLYVGGFVGFTLLLLCLYQAICTVWQLGKKDIVMAQIIGPMLISIMVYNLAETAFFGPRSPIFIVFVSLIVLVRVVRHDP